MALFLGLISRRLSALVNLTTADNTIFYEYQTISPNDIRILILQPGDEKDEICISISTEAISQQSEHAYKAVSYVWGSTKLSRDIQCNGSTLKVTANVFELLQRLRHPDTPARLWIDAICINQQDLPERNHQVSLMKFIYSNASQVLIWTGEGDGNAASVFSTLELIARDEEGFFKEPQKDSLRHISAFISKPSNWFHRAWCFQEVCLARDAQVLYGKHQLPWDTMAKAFRSLESHGLSQSIFGDIADCMAASSRFYVDAPEREQPYLSTVLPLTRNLKATDDRDKVFAMLGLINTSFLECAGPDYTLSVVEIYSRYTRAMIAQEQGLSVFSSVMGPAQRPGLPSWVPDWRLPRETAYLHGYDWPATTNFYDLNQHMPVLYCLELGAVGGLLTLDGACIGTITSVQSGSRLLKALNPGLSNMVDRVTGWNGFFPHFASLFKSLKLPEIYAQTGEPSKTALLRVLSANHLPEPGMIRSFVETTMYNLYRKTRSSSKIPQYSRLNAYINDPRYKDYLGKGYTANDIDTFLFLCQMALDVLDFKLPKPRGSFFGTTEQSIFGHDKGYNIVDYVASMVQTFLRKRVAFKTDNGLIGIGPDYVAVGDQVWDLLGGSVPFILRKGADVSENEFKLMGECYVHGIMNGEMWEPSVSDNPSAVNGQKLNFAKVRLV